MNVKELITHLQGLPEDATVLVAKDKDINAFSPADEAFSAGLYFADSPYSGEFVSNEDGSEEEDSDEFDEGYYATNGVPAVVIWPLD